VLAAEDSTKIGLARELARTAVLSAAFTRMWLATVIKFLSIWGLSTAEIGRGLARTLDVSRI
jgi:hypothetical protein